MTRRGSWVMMAAGALIVALAALGWDMVSGFGCAFANLDSCPRNWTGAEVRRTVWPFFGIGALLILWGAVSLRRQP